MKAADVMTRVAITVHPEDSILSAVRLMLENRMSGLPVVNATGQLTGIVTEGDFIRRAELATEKRRSWWREQFAGAGKLAAEYVHTHARKVADVMTSQVHTVLPSTPLEQIVNVMERFKIKRVPVMDGKTVIGIVSRADLLRAAFWLIVDPARAAAPPVSNEKIRAQFIAEMERQSWSPKACVEPRVHDGVVDLCGTILDDRERSALRVMAENIPGVIGVRDYLVYIEPMSGMPVIELTQISQERN